MKIPPARFGNHGARRTPIPTGGGATSPKPDLPSEIQTDVLAVEVLARAILRLDPEKDIPAVRTASAVLTFLFVKA